MNIDELMNIESRTDWAVLNVKVLDSIGVDVPLNFDITHSLDSIIYVLKLKLK